MIIAIDFTKPILAVVKNIESSRIRLVNPTQITLKNWQCLLGKNTLIVILPDNFHTGDFYYAGQNFSKKWICIAYDLCSLLRTTITTFVNFAHKKFPKARFAVYAVTVASALGLCSRSPQQESQVEARVDAPTADTLHKHFVSMIERHPQYKKQKIDVAFEKGFPFLRLENYKIAPITESASLEGWYLASEIPSGFWVMRSDSRAIPAIAALRCENRFLIKIPKNAIALVKNDLTKSQSPQIPQFSLVPLPPRDCKGVP